MLMPKFASLQLTQLSSNVLQIMLYRPNVCNAINSVMMQDLKDCWAFCTKQSELRCIVLTGAGDAFCAGADLKERQHIDLNTWHKHRTILEDAMRSMVACPMPIIAAVNGAAFGGGLELMLACDFAYAAEHAYFAQSEVKLGLMPGAMGTQHLPRACGLARARELTFTAKRFSAQEALDWGIVNKVCSLANLMDEVTTTAKLISDNAPLAIREAKMSLNASHHQDIQSGFLKEIEHYQTLLHTKDREEGILAFNEKRKPNFIGE